MAMQVQPMRIGVDVSKAELVICQDPQQPLLILVNEQEAITAWLDGLPPGACLAVEATNTFHLPLVTLAHARGHTVYIIDGFRLDRYRQSVGGRAKTDACDARLLRRYLEREQADLRPWSPPSKGYLTLQQLLHRRATLVQAKVQLEQSLAAIPDLKQAAKAVFMQIARLDALLQRKLREAVRAHGWDEDVARCQALEGIGPVTAAALVMAFQRGRFRSSDAFIAFLGLDVKVRQSGAFRGRGKLTKQGDPELRRLLFLAAMRACRSASWRPFYERHLARGLTKIQSLVALGRKLARVAFALLKHQSAYQSRAAREACTTT